MSRKRIALYVGLSIIPLIAALWIAGVDPNFLLGNNVTANSAYVTGDLMQASAPVGGAVTRILAQVGDPVHPGQTVAYLSSPAQTDTGISIGPPVKAPGLGTIVHLSVLVGQNVVPGQSIATIADLQKLYVVAAVDENSFAPVRAGQTADVFIPALNQTYPGTVSQLLPDLAQTVPRTAGATAAATGPRATGEVPVRIDFSYGDSLVYPGMNATVTIKVKD